MQVGFSVGALYKTDIFPMSHEALDVFKAIGCKVIELSVIRTERLAGLKKMTAQDLAGFEYISIHAPALEYLYEKSAAVKQLFDELSTAHQRIHFNAVVIHPDRVKDWTIFNDYDLPWAFENMDDRKDFGQTVEDMQKVFAIKNAKMVFDVQHAFTNDQTMQRAADFITEFSARITHIHLSGYDPKHLHCPLFESKQEQIIKSIAGQTVPVIIESSVAAVDDIAKEYQYVSTLLQ